MRKSLNTIITFILHHVDLRLVVPIKNNQAQQKAASTSYYIYKKEKTMCHHNIPNKIPGEILSSTP